MGYSKSRIIPLLITLTTLTSSLFSTLLIHNLPNDPYRLASTFGYYFHFANLLSITGVIGTIKQHPLSITIFANYLLLDTLLFSIPRFLLLGIFYQLSTSFCTPVPISTSLSYSILISPPHLTFNHINVGENVRNRGEGGPEKWTGEGCLQVLYLAQLALVAGVLAATVLQVVGALWVRGYARGLWRRELGWRRVVDCEEEGLGNREVEAEIGGGEKL